jgi:hypothetical protein
MKKHCGCSDYDKCEHEIAEVGATPQEAKSKDGKQEDVEVEKKDRCWDGYEPVPGKKPYEKGSCAPVKKHEEIIDDIMKSWEGPEVLCTCGADGLSKAEKPFKGYNPEKHAETGGLNDKYREKYNRETGSNLKRPSKDKNNPRHKSFCARMKGVKGPTSKDGELTPKGAALQRWACSKSDLGKSYAQIKKESSMKKSEDLEKGLKDMINKLKPSSKPKLGVTPDGKKYEDLSHDELKDHMARTFADSPKEGPKKGPQAPAPLAASEGARDLDKGDIIDMKSKAKTAGAKPAAPAVKKPDTRSRDEKIKDALASQGEKGSPYASARPSANVGARMSDSKPSEPSKPGIHAGMSREELMAQVDKTPDITKPKEAAKLKVIKSLEGLTPKLYKGMSMAELKKAEEQYTNLKSKVEQLLAKGDVEAIKIALEKIKGFQK